jgi:hypothetical protein
MGRRCVRGSYAAAVNAEWARLIHLLYAARKPAKGRAQAPQKIPAAGLTSCEHRSDKAQSAPILGRDPGPILGPDPGSILGQRRAQVCAPIWLRALSQGQDRPGPRACAIGNCRIWHAGSACLASPSGGSAYQRPRLGAAARAGWAWLIAMPVGPDHGASGRPSKDWQVPPPHQQDAEIGWRLARPAAPCTGILIPPFGSPLPGTLARRLQTSARTRPRSPLDRASATR